MNNELIIKLKGNLDKMIKDNKFMDKFIILFGANNPGDVVITYLEQNDLTVNAIIDNNPVNRGKKMLEVPIYTPNELLKQHNDNIIVLICSKYYSEMRVQLEEMGYSANKHIFKVLEMNADVSYSVEYSLFKYNAKEAIRGLGVYNKIINNYDESTYIFICPVKANGDVYLTCSYLEQFLINNNISNYVLTVIGDACGKVGKMLDVKNIEIISQDETEHLIRIQRFLGFEQSRMKIIQPYWLYTSFLNYLDGYKNLTFGDFYKYCLFDLDEDIQAKQPVLKNQQAYLEELFNKNSFKKNNTVIISPYANSLPQLATKFWVRLAEILDKKGYTVCTNSSGENEPVISKTKPIYFSFENAIAVAEYAGYFVGIRSGLCEVISSAKCKKIIIYPDKGCGFGKVIDVYGINNMNLSHDAVEFEATENVENMLETVLKNIYTGD